MRGYYHNMTKKVFNIWIPDITDESDLKYEEGDIVYRSESGDATLYLVEHKELSDLFRLYEEDSTEEGE